MRHAGQEGLFAVWAQAAEVGRVGGDSIGRLAQLGSQGLRLADDLWPGLLRRGDDAHCWAALRHGSLWCRLSRLAAPNGSHHCRRHLDQQNGAGSAQDLRPDARAALGHFHGQLRQRRRLLSLLVFGGPRLRPHHTRRHLRARLPAHSRGPALRHPAVAEEDQAHAHPANVVQEVGALLEKNALGL